MSVTQYCQIAQVDDDDTDAANAGAPVEEEEDEAGDQDEEPEAARGSDDPPPSKMTKAQLFAMYKGKGPHAMNLDILSDEEVRAHACIIVHVTTPLHCQYQSELKAQTNGLASLIQWAAARANGEWVHVVYSILGVQSSSELYAAMRCAPHCDPPAAFDWGTIQDDITLTQQVTSFAIELAAKLCLGTNAVHIHASSGQRCPSISPACGTKNCNAQTPVLSSEHFDC